MSKHLQREIDRLEKLILELCALTEESFQLAVKAVAERDSTLGQQVVDRDLHIDHMEVDVEEECLKILALHQPVASDLRYVIAILKINNDLERIGDLAVNTADKALLLAGRKQVEFPFDFEEMAEKTQGMLKRSIDALVNFDSALAREVIESDEEVDAIHRSMYERIQEAVPKEPDQVDTYILLLNVSRNLERIADYTTNIAEDVIYMIDGEIIRHQTTA